MTFVIELPRGDAIYLDHLAHWVADIHAASALLERLGFLATPYAEHTHAAGAGDAPVPAGSANQCVMLEAGYLEL
ncbi:MAG: VOC family protein, partial [Gammaproteobacteria bacterium]|nr:VOC family protein [Gammaproteobacteria bacterium]